MQGDENRKVEIIKALMEVSRSLGMEPLVEVNSGDEMKLAIQAGSKVIGINNRNLHNFSVDLNTTTRIVSGHHPPFPLYLTIFIEGIPSNVIICALSGITCRKDVEYFEAAGVKAVLIGEALMRDPNPHRKIQQLRGLQSESSGDNANEESTYKTTPLVKICGIRDAEMALHTAESGAQFIGLMFAEKSSRKLSIERVRF